MLRKSCQLLLIIMLGWQPVTLLAETVYINDRFQVGIHKEKSVDSVIIKLVPSGTALDMIKKDEPLSQVRDPDGVIGWVDNQFLATTEPGRAQLAEAERRIAELETGLQNATQGRPAGAKTADTPEQEQILKEKEELEQLLKSERLRVGELQAQTAELKNRLSEIQAPADTGQQDKLRDENSRLRERLEKLQAKLEIAYESSPVEKPVVPEINLGNFVGDFNWEKMLITVAISLLAGIGVGIYLLDLYHRRRHGGFRI